jgi:hypothetical protein
MKKFPLLLLSCCVPIACQNNPYPAVRPLASAYVRPVRPPGWTTGVDSIEELRRYGVRHPLPPASPPGSPHRWSPAEIAYGEALVRQWDEEKARAAQIQAAQEANAANQEIASKLDAINRSIQDMPMNQYIWSGR